MLGASRLHGAGCGEGETGKGRAGCGEGETGKGRAGGQWHPGTRLLRLEKSKFANEGPCSAALTARDALGVFAAPLE